MAKTRKRNESGSVIDQPVESSDTVTSPADRPDTEDNSDHRDRIAMRAYELYLARGGSDGGDFDDWLAAEREIVGGHGAHGDEGE